MPSPTVICEFCSEPFRKDRYGVHVKAKHVRELAQIMLENCKKDVLNVIKSISRGNTPTTIPVYTRRDGCFFFGRVPRYFLEEESCEKYINNDENMRLHKEFLQRVIASIPLTDFLTRYQPYGIGRVTQAESVPPVETLRHGLHIQTLLNQK